jgi:ATP-binding cassette, subfamily B, bacterial IrtB/YbtQ
MTAVQPVVEDVEPDSPEKSPRGEAKRGANFHALALQQLLAPARRAMAKAQRIQWMMSVVERLADGWQTRVGEGGSALSGGERRRVSIARALVKNAPIVLFDEATSALDPENEHHVAESIRRLAQRSTVIVIAHKLSTVTAADNIVVLSAEGTVQDSGAHADLLARGGQYADFWAQRVSATGWTMTAGDVGRRR